MLDTRVHMSLEQASTLQLVLTADHVLKAATVATSPLYTVVSGVLNR